MERRVPGGLGKIGIGTVRVSSAHLLVGLLAGRQGGATMARDD